MTRKLKILLTGANGYIGKRLLPVLIDQGHQVVCCLRDTNRFSSHYREHPNVSLIQVDFLKSCKDIKFPEDTDVAYYLIHSMSDKNSEFEKMEAKSAESFLTLLNKTKARQLIYLGGIANQEKLSRHLSSRKNVEQILRGGTVPLTSLNAGIIVGSGSSSFEIIRDLVEKLPVMIAPKWLNTKTQPIAIRNVIEFLSGILLKADTFGKSYDIGGPDVLSYKEMLLQFAEVRKLKRKIFTVPALTPRLSSYWLYFITNTSYNLAVNLVNSMKVEVVARQNNLHIDLGIRLLTYKEAVNMAFQKIEQRNVVSSWKDSIISSAGNSNLLMNIKVPENGCFINRVEIPLLQDSERVLENIWSIGGQRGWYYGNVLWKIRGFIDKLAGGVGLRRGRTNENSINEGDTLDFWRVLVANKIGRRLLLFAEMKLPGEAWLDFQLLKKNNMEYLIQTATFRPKGLAGRIYWYLMLPFHTFIFKGMASNIVRYSK